MITDELPSLSPYQVAIYGFLKNLDDKHKEMNEVYLDLNCQVAIDSNNTQLNDSINKMRQDIAKLSVYSKLFNDLHEQFQSLKNCLEIMNDPKEDKEMKEIAREDLEFI